MQDTVKQRDWRKGDQSEDYCSNLGLMSPRTKVVAIGNRKEEWKERHCDKTVMSWRLTRCKEQNSQE